MSGGSRAPSRTGLLLLAVLILFGIILVGVVVYGLLASRQLAGPAAPAGVTPLPATAGAKSAAPGATALPAGAAGGIDGLVAIFFTAPRDPDRPEDRRGGLDEHLTAFLKTARTSIDLAIYDLDLDNVTEAMLDASKRGVRVRVVTDTDNLKNEPITKLKEAKIPVIDDKRSAIMHHKFAVVDGEAVWMGSWNFTVYDTYRYNNNGALWRNRALAQAYTAEFELLFAGQFGARSRTDKPAADLISDEARGVRIEAYFTPTDNPSLAIVRRIREARSSVVFMAFSFTHDEIGRAMLDRHRQGVKVRGVFEKTGTEAATSPSEFKTLRDAGADVLQDGNRYLMHHKVIVLDERTVVFGSFNFSASAEENNENCLVVESPELARLFLAEFERVYARAAAARSSAPLHFGGRHSTTTPQ